MRFKQIVRFNWPFYTAATLVTGAAPLVISRLPAWWWIRVPAQPRSASSRCAQVVARRVVDRPRPLTPDDGTGCPGAGFHPRSYINIHAGDESSAAPAGFTRSHGPRSTSSRPPR
jgi:hypothetical protein